MAGELTKMEERYDENKTCFLEDNVEDDVDATITVNTSLVDQTGEKHAKTENPLQNMENVKKYRHFKVLWALFEIFCFGGLKLGWGALVYVLKEEGIYTDLCKVHMSNMTSTQTNTSGTNSRINGTLNQQVHPTCPEQDLKLNLVYTVGTGCAVVFTLVGGQIFSRFGTRIVRCIYIFVLWMGLLMIAFASPDYPWLVGPGITFLTGGSLVFLLTSSQLCNMYGKGSIIVLGLMNGVQDSSSAIQLFVKLAYSAGISSKHSYLAIFALSMTTIASTFTIYPSKFIKKASEIKSDTENGPDITNLKPEKTEFKKYVCNPIFLLHISWFGILVLHFIHFIATVNAYLYHVTDETEEVSYFTNVLAYTMFTGVVPSLLAGFLYDKQKQRYRATENEILRKVRPALVPMFVATVLMLVLATVTMFPYRWMLYITFIDFTVFRSFMFCVAMSFLADTFPTESFGILYTVMHSLSSVMNFVEYGLFEWWHSYDRAMLHVQIFLLSLSIVAFVHPITLLINCCRLSAETRTEQTVSTYFAVLDDTHKC